MIALFFMAATAATSAAAKPVPPVQPAPTAATTSPARSVIEAQLRSPPRQNDRRALSADEADTIYRHYLASIGQRPNHAPGGASDAAP